MKHFFLILIFCSLLIETQAQKVRSIDKSEDIDTILVFSVRSGLPKGIKLRFPLAGNNPHSTEEYQSVAYQYRGNLFIPLPEKKISPPIPDSFGGKFTDIQGNICYASGGLKGIGMGKCEAMFARKTKPLKRNLIVMIEP
jgi:hypothetical protein